MHLFNTALMAGKTFRDSPFFEGLSAGDYDIVVQDTFMCEYTVTINITTLVSSGNVLKEYGLKVFPNPSENGVFKIEVKGMESNLPFLPIQVVDVLGQPVIYKNLARANGDYEGLLSLHAYPAGIYYVRFIKGGINKMVRLVKL